MIPTRQTMRATLSATVKLATCISTLMPSSTTTLRTEVFQHGAVVLFQLDQDVVLVFY